MQKHTWSDGLTVTFTGAVEMGEDAISYNYEVRPDESDHDSIVSFIYHKVEGLEEGFYKDDAGKIVCDVETKISGEGFHPITALAHANTAWAVHETSKVASHFTIAC